MLDFLDPREIAASACSFRGVLESLDSVVLVSVTFEGSNIQVGCNGLFYSETLVPNELVHDLHFELSCFLLDALAFQHDTSCPCSPQKNFVDLAS